MARALEPALARLEPRPGATPAIVPGEPGGPLVRVGPEGIALDPALLDGDAHHPRDADWLARAPEAVRGLAPDRWRRAAAAVLEGAALAALPEEAGAPSWWREARAAEAADRAAPELGALWPDLADLLASPEVGVAGAPGRAAFWVRWLRREGREPAWGAPSAEAWLAFGRWLFDPAAGPAVAAPLPLPMAAPTPPGAWYAAPLSFRRVAVAAGPAGAHARASGAADAGDVRLLGGERAVVIVGAVEGGEASVGVEPVGPVGVWTLRAGRLEQRVGAARGIELTLRADGSGEVTLADAFVGPASGEAVSLASRFGVSGQLVGRWRVVAVQGGEATIELGEVRPQGVTVHPRGRRGFAVPAGPVLGRAEGWLAKVAGSKWRIRPTAEGVEAVGGDVGPTVTLVFARG